MQKEGVNYVETFAPTVKLASVRVIAALAAKNSWPLRQFDISSAYLNGKIEEEIFMELAPGFVSPNFPTGVHRLRMGLYGLCRAGHIWNKALHGASLSPACTSTMGSRRRPEGRDQ